MVVVVVGAEGGVFVDVGDVGHGAIQIGARRAQ